LKERRRGDTKGKGKKKDAVVITPLDTSEKGKKKRK